jgi:hypothetical protein
MAETTVEITAEEKVKILELEANRRRAQHEVLANEADHLRDQRDILLGLIRERGILSPGMVDDVYREMAKEAPPHPEIFSWPFTMEYDDMVSLWKYWAYDTTARLKQAMERADQGVRLQRAKDRSADREWAKLLSGERAAVPHG